MFLDVVVGKIWFALKGVVALVAFISGVLVVTGIECGVDSTVMQIIIGAGMILASIFVMADFGGLKQALDRLHSENDRLATNNENLEQSLNRQKEQLDQAESQLSRRDKQIRVAREQLDERAAQIVEQSQQLASLEKVNAELQDTNTALQEGVQEIARERKQLEETVFGLKLAVGEGERQIHERNKQIKEAQTQLDELTKANRIQKESIRALESHAQTVDEQIRKRDKQIAESEAVVSRMESALAKQKIIQDNANKLIQSLMSAGDDFKDFKDVIRESLNRIDNTADMLEVLATKMTGSKFSEMDADGDGVIDEEEMRAWIARQAGST